MEEVKDYQLGLAESFTLLFGSFITVKAQNEIILRLLTEEKAAREGKSVNEVSEAIDHMFGEARDEQIRLHQKQLALLGKEI